MMKKLSIISFLLIMFCSCTPSKQFVKTEQQSQLNLINAKIKNKNVKIDRVHGNSIESPNVSISEDSVFYFKNTQKSLPISEVTSITISKKINVFSVVGGSLVGFGTYSVVTANNADTLGGALGKFFYGIGSFVIGAATLIIGTDSKREIYYLNQSN